METIYKKIGFCVIVLLNSSIVCKAFQVTEYTEHKMNFTELVKFSKLAAHDWVSENITREDKVVNINNINGEIKMSFSVEREQKIGSKHKKRFRKFKYCIGGVTHDTNFTIIGDTVHFHGYKGWNDCKIIELKKDKLVLEQDYQNSIVRWKLIPQRKIKSTKSNIYDFKREMGRYRKFKKRNK